jgi:PKD repeat protein
MSPHHLVTDSAMPALRPLGRTSIVALGILVVLQGCTSGERTTAPDVTTPRRSTAAAAVDPVIVAAGDIVCGTGTPAGTPCQHAQTAAVVGQIAPDAVLILGDNQYEDGTLADFNTYYAPTWGRYKAITWPAVGNHEYQTPNARGYYDYFNGVGVQTGRAGDRAKGYYSYDLGSWHLVALNSNCGSVGGCGAGSPQEQWLRADLAAHPAACVLAYWHHPRFSSGPHGSDATYQAFWQALVAFDADVVLVGHDHIYERFNPQSATGVADAAHGLRQWVVGTGGKEHYAFATIRANSALRNSTAFGVLKLTLHPTSYDWQFVPVPGATLNDVGTATCNGASTGNRPPTASISAPAAGANFPQGASVSFSGSGSDPENGALGGASLVWTSSINGQIGTGASFSTSSLSVGTHTITLTAKDAQGATGTATRSITITPSGGGNQAPVARYTITCPTLQCTADASASTDDVGIVSYAWNWGNGRSEIKTVPTVKNTWATAGTYTVTLTVKDAGGRASSVAKQVVIPTPAGNRAPVARFTITCPTRQCSADASASTDDVGIVSYAWNWGNGRSETKTVPTVKNTWASAGTYTVTLTVRDAGGLTGSVSKQVTIP